MLFVQGCNAQTLKPGLTTVYNVRQIHKCWSVGQLMDHFPLHSVSNKYNVDVQPEKKQQVTKYYE